MARTALRREFPGTGVLGVRMVRTGMAGLVTCLLAGCASAGSSGSAPAAPASGASAARAVGRATERRPLLADNIGVLYADAPADQRRDLPMTAAVAQQAMREAFAAFFIPITVDDAALHAVGNPDFYRSREFMGRRMTELVDCGGSMTGPNAASFRIFMSLIARAKDNGKGGSMVSVQLIASGRDLASGSSTDRLACGSTGRIEQRLLDEIAKRATP